jgi:hypothetical protein
MGNKQTNIVYEEKVINYDEIDKYMKPDYKIVETSSFVFKLLNNNINETNKYYNLFRHWSKNYNDIKYKRIEYHCDYQNNVCIYEECPVFIKRIYDNYENNKYASIIYIKENKPPSWKKLLDESKLYDD